MLFQKTWGPTGNLYYNDIRFADQCDNGDYFLIGTTTMGPVYGTNSYYACRLDSIGTILWEDTWGGVDLTNRVVTAIKSFYDSYIVVGSGGAGSGVSDIMISDIDADGNIRFCNYIDPAYKDYGFGITKTLDSCFVICGARGIGFDDRCPIYIKIDRDGNEIWRRSYTSVFNHWPTHIAATPDSGFIVLGVRDNYNTFYAKYDKTGTMQWLKYPFGLSDTFPDFVGNIRANVDGSTDIYYQAYLATDNPSVEVTGWLQHYDSQGDTIWTKQYFNSYWGDVWIHPEDSTFCVIDGADNGFIYLDDAYQPVHIVESGPTALAYIETRDGGYLSFGQYYDAGSNCNRFQIAKFTPDGRYIAQPFLSEITIAPNPSLDGNITLSFDIQYEENVQVRVLAMDGRLVYYDEIFCPANSHTELPIHLDAATTTAGMYILEVKTDGEYRRERLIIARKVE